MAGAGGGGGRPSWAPRSWAVGRPDGPGGAEELDVDPRELARRIRAHRARGEQGLVDFDAPGEGEDGLRHEGA
jgi:hypothetical protein